MKLHIYTFGSFNITYGTQTHVNLSIRNSRMWKALKYLIAYRDKPVPAERLIEVLWPEDDCADPGKSLRDIIYRLRKTLTMYGGAQPYIGFSQGCYFWNPDVPCSIDVAEFEQSLRIARDSVRDIEERVPAYRRAVALYQGGFLSESASELGVLHFANCYRRLYLQAIEELADLYERHFDIEEVILLYDKAVAVEPREETLYIRQIQALIKNGEYALAKRQYLHIEKILLRDFKTKPSKVLQNLLEEIYRVSSLKADNLDEIKKQLEEDFFQKGVVFCGPETFRQLYCYDKRSEERVQFPVFLGLITVTDVADCPGDEEKLRLVMKALRRIMLRTLRRGDVICQYSPNQFILMLTALDSIKGQAALNRIKMLFVREFDESPVNLATQVAPVGNGEEKMFYVT